MTKFKGKKIQFPVNFCEIYEISYLEEISIILKFWEVWEVWQNTKVQKYERVV